MMEARNVFNAALAASLLALAGCGQAPAPGADMAGIDQDSPEWQAFQYRGGLMHAIAFKMGTLRAMAQGDVPVDGEVFTEYAADLAALSGMITEGFPAGSAVPTSRALPDIWQSWDDFVQRAADFEAAAGELAATAASGGFAAGQARIDQVGQTCGGCHRPYRADE